MLVWINGPFGVGKTQVAAELQRRLPSSVVCDPEHLGFGLKRMQPSTVRRDFQDYPAWRQGVFEALDLALNEHHGTLIAPMTIIEPQYFDETVGRLREAGHQVRHFALLAEPETVRRRLSDRNGGNLLRHVGGNDFLLRRETFAFNKLELCLERLREPQFAEQVWTDHMSVPKVADDIASTAGLCLQPNTDGRVRGLLRRTCVSAQHIRLM